ncbi:MAG: hypothetical protein ACTSR3_09640 [Candidatus Helarchaeota archaeon]
MVVHNLYLLDKDGLSLVDITVGSLKIDPNLASGFFIAILKFIKELLKSDEEVITDMGMLNMRLYFVYYPPLIGVIAVDPEDSKEEVTSVVKYILQEFQKKYDLNNWNHDVYPFREFSEYMKQKIKNYYEKVRYQIFYKAYQIYDKYKDFGIESEWDEKIELLQQSLGPQFMMVTGSYFEYMGSKIMGADIMQSADIEPEYDLETQLMISDTNINIWNKDLFLIVKETMKYLENIDAYFAIKFQS